MKTVLYIVVGFLIGILYNISLAHSLDLGQDYLGIKHSKFDCNMASSLLPTGHSIGALIDDTFGDSNQCLERIIAEKRPVAVRAHLLNGACIRGRYCVAGSEASLFSVAGLEQEVRTPTSKFYRVISPRIAYIKQLQQRYPETKFYISPILEHDLSVQAAQRMFEEVSTT